jgi:arylsulfatase A-like enzyme
MQATITHPRIRWLVAALTSCALGWGAITGSVATGAAAMQPSRPNVLIYLTDDQRDAGSMIEMPAVRWVFGHGGTEFTSGFVTTPQCCPSRASIFSGQYAHNTGIIINDGTTFNSNDTWVRYLHDRGYFTGMIGKYLNLVPTFQAPHFDYANVGRNATEPEQVTIARAVNQFFARAERVDSQPWALVVAAYSPHSPWTTVPKHLPGPIPRFAAPYKSPSYQEEDRSDKHPSVQRRSYGDQTFSEAYYGQQMETHAADEEFLQVWQTIRDRREGGNLLGFFLSDNGFAWGDHGLWGKGEPYLENSEVPFYVRWPGHFGARVQDTRTAANIDIAPTIYQATGINPRYLLDGRSLLGQWRRPWLLLEYLNPDTPLVPPWYSYVAPGKRQYVQWSDGFVEDYNLRGDPGELTARNVADPTIAAKLDAAKTCAGATCP